MRIRGNTIVFSGIMAIMLVVIISSLAMESFESKALPLIISSTIFVLAVIGLWQDMVRKDKGQAAAIDDEEGTTVEAEGDWRGYLLNGGWIVVFALAVFLLGLSVATFLFLLFYMRQLGSRWLEAIIYAVVVPGLFFLIFQFALHIDLYPGMIFKWMGF